MTKGPPWMPLNVADYLKDTSHLVAHEHGAYVLLAMFVRRYGALPEPSMMRRHAHMSAEQWSESGERIVALFRRGSSGYSAYERMVGEDRRRSIPRALRRLVFGRDGHRCVYCGTVDGPFQIDHKFPWSRGGRHELDNLCVACLECNAAKGALTEQEFREAIA